VQGADLNTRHFDVEASRSAASFDLLNLDSHAYLIELLPLAAYAVRAPDGVIAWFNSRAAELWGRAIHRHSGSKTARIRLSRSLNNVVLEIQDDGKGIPTEKLDGMQKQRSGVGITGMRERVRHLKGAMEIHSNGTGTKVLVMLPASNTDISETDGVLQKAGLLDKPL
jgi:hypothetical protein